MSDSKFGYSRVRLRLILYLFVDIPLSVELLVKELKDVTNWYVFGVSLGIPISKLDIIKKECSDVEEQKIKMFQFWLQYNVHASWKMMIEALEQNNYLTLATTLSRKYLSDTAGECYYRYTVEFS